MLILCESQTSIGIPLLLRLGFPRIRLWTLFSFVHLMRSFPREHTGRFSTDMLKPILRFSFEPFVHSEKKKNNLYLWSFSESYVSLIAILSQPSASPSCTQSASTHICLTSDTESVIALPQTSAPHKSFFFEFPLSGINDTIIEIGNVCVVFWELILSSKLVLALISLGSTIHNWNRRIPFRE